MQNRTGKGKGIYVIALILVSCILVFTVGLLAKKQDEGMDSSITENTIEITTVPAATTVSTEPPTAVTEGTQTEAASETAEPTDAPAETETQDEGSGTEIQMDADHIYIRVNHKKTVEFPADFGTDASYSISDDNVADVDENGLLTGLQKGECVLTVTSGEKSLTFPVTVREMLVEDGCTYVDGILVANKSYSLPETYDPGLLPETEEAFAALSADAAAQGLNIYNSSDYRSYSFQVQVYQSMVDGYSKEYADSVSARPGHSEHQTGYTIDCNSINNEFAETAEGKWLEEHCWEYGFIIRYPEDKVELTGYSYESWHIRYVGVEHAKAIWEQGICLEEYLDIDSKYAESEE